MSRAAFPFAPAAAWRLAALALALAVACCPARAIDPALTLAQLHHTAWSTRDGAPAQVQALAQTSDGILWLGSAAGLYRFDGLQFERFQPPPGEGGTTGAISALLACDGDGGLWIGYRFGGVGHWQGGRLTYYGRGDGIAAGTVLALARDADGRLWAATTTGLSRFDGKQWGRPPQAEGYPEGFTYALHVDRAGTLWAVAELGTWRLPRGAAHFERSSRSINFGWLAERPDGRMWIANGALGLYPLADGDAPPPHREPPPVPGPGDLGPVLFDHDGVLWAGSEHGLSRLADVDHLPPTRPGGDLRSDPSQRITRDGGLSGNEIYALLEDREGDVWVSTSGGLDRFRANKLTRAELPAGFNWPSVAPAPGGGVWMGSLDVNAARLGDHPLRVDVGPRITSVLRDRHGTVWMGGARGLWRIDGDTARKVPLPGPVEGMPVQAMIDDDGALRLAVLRVGQWVQDAHADGGWRHEPEPPGVPDVNPLSMLRDARGRLWLGYGFDRLVRLEPGRQPRAWLSADGLEVGGVLSLMAQGERTWLGGEMGLAVIVGDSVHMLRIAGNDAVSGVSGIVADDAGNVWLNSAIGVVRLPAAEIAQAIADPAHRIAAERMDYHDGLDGLPALLRPIPTAVRDDDGRLWFATDNSLVWIDPRRIRRNAVPPPVDILALEAGGRRWPLGAPPTLPVGTRELELRYGAGTLAQPERVRFRVQLEGVDAGWQDADARRAAHYTNLAPGRYVFRVIACNEDGVWSTQPAALEFTVPPALHQTWWFRLLGVPLGALLVWALVRWRVRAQAERWADRHEAILIERERIARELHDTLLQSVQGLILRFQSGVDRMPASDPTRATLEHSLDRAEQVLLEGRDRVSELRSSVRSAGTLGESLRGLGEELAEQHGAGFAATLRGEGAALPDRVHDELRHIGGEALLNAFRHANAGMVRLLVQQGATRLVLEIADDGVGMPPTREHAAGLAGHWGLAGMRERARAIGARFTLESAEGQGTRVRLQVPLRSGPLGWLRQWTARRRPTQEEDTP